MCLSLSPTWSSNLNSHPALSYRWLIAPQSADPNPKRLMLTWLKEPPAALCSLRLTASSSKHSLTPLECPRSTRSTRASATSTVKSRTKWTPSSCHLQPALLTIWKPICRECCRTASPLRPRTKMALFCPGLKTSRNTRPISSESRRKSWSSHSSMLSSLRVIDNWSNFRKASHPWASLAERVLLISIPTPLQKQETRT